MSHDADVQRAGRGSEDLQAVLAARRELGPEYDRALVENFVDRAEAELRARAAARAPDDPGRASQAPGRTRGPATADVGAGGFGLALATIAWGLLSTFLAVVAGGGANPAIGLAVVAGWGALGLCDLVYLALALDRARRRRS